MATVRAYPPPERVIARLAALPGARLTPGAVFAIDGPAPSGPEQANAVLVLQATMVDFEAAARFWAANETVLSAAIESPGFVRFIGLSDGLCTYAIVFWRSAEEAKTFADGHVHRAAVADLYRRPSQYTHFARLFAAAGRGVRHFFCEKCGRVAAAPASNCAGCGTLLTDVFDTYSRPDTNRDATAPHSAAVSL
jgi:hypothetical protein